jgi:hypothetical protein
MTALARISARGVVYAHRFYERLEFTASHEGFKLRLAEA